MIDKQKEEFMKAEDKEKAIVESLFLSAIDAIVKDENKLTGSVISGEECKALGNG